MDSYTAAQAEPAITMPRDNCQVCRGERGGVPGNENVVDDIVMCDYCTVTYRNLRAVEAAKSRYLRDTAQTLYDELVALEQVIEGAAQLVKRSGENSAKKRALYEELKNKALIEMYAEEAENKDIKRTEAKREMLYRTKYATERLDWLLADNEFESNKKYLEALIANQVSIESRAKLLDVDGRMAGRV